MSDIVRFGVSIEKDLSGKFDKYINKKGYQNRSKAIGDLIREALVAEEWSENTTVAGGISLVYDHHKRELLNKLMDIQHDFHDLIISTQHIHLKHSVCLELLVVKGNAEDIRNLYNRLKSVKGVKHVGIMKSSIGENI